MSGALAASIILNQSRPRLSGTAISPNIDSDFEIHPINANAGWHFFANGDCTKFTGAAHNKPEWFGKRGETTHETPNATFWIRATTESGDLPDTGTMNTWLSMAGNNSWYWTEITPFEDSTGTIKIEIASDSGGTDIRATGYYRGVAVKEI